MILDRFNSSPGGFSGISFAMTSLVLSHLVVTELSSVFEYSETGSTAIRGTGSSGLVVLDTFPGFFNELIADT